MTVVVPFVDNQRELRDLRSSRQSFRQEGVFISSRVLNDTVTVPLLLI